MSTRFTDFVLKLAEDPALLNAYQEDPLAAAKTAGLSPAEQSILVNPTPKIVRDAIVQEIGRTGTGVDEVSAVIVVVYTWTRSSGIVASPTPSVLDRLRRLSQPGR